MRKSSGAVIPTIESKIGPMKSPMKEPAYSLMSVKLLVALSFRRKSTFLRPPRAFLSATKSSLRASLFHCTRTELANDVFLSAVSTFFCTSAISWSSVSNRSVSNAVTMTETTSRLVPCRIRSNSTFLGSTPSAVTGKGRLPVRDMPALPSPDATWNRFLAIWRLAPICGKVAMRAFSASWKDVLIARLTRMSALALNSRLSRIL